MSFPRYPAYKDSGVTSLGHVPEHWFIGQVKHVCSFFTGWTPPTGDASSYVGDNYWANISDLGPKRLTETNKQISDDAVAKSDIRVSRAGDLLFSFKLSIGQVSFAGVDLYTNEAIATFPPSDRLNLRYGYYALPFFLVRNASENIYGAKLLNQELMKSARLVLPPLSEQEQLADFLESETAKIDALVAEQEQLITLLKEKRQAVISHAVTKGLDPSVPTKDSGVEWLGEIPAHWEVKRIKDCGCEVVDCKNRTPEPHIDGEYFVVRTSCVKDGEFNPEPGYWTDEENFIEWTAKGRPQVGDVLFTREAPTGEACLAPEGLDFCLGQRMMYVRPPKEALLSEFLLYSIYGGLARERINEKSKGSTVGHLRVGEVGELPLLLPPIEEQQALVRFLGEELAKLRALAAQAEDAIALMTERRSALISAAVTGQIDVRGLAPAQAQAA